MQIYNLTSPLPFALQKSFPFFNEIHLYTQVMKFSQALTKTPPNPQFWGNKNSQSPPLGDLGGIHRLKRRWVELGCTHEPSQGEGKIFV